MVTRRTVPELAQRAEQALVPIVREGADPVDTTWLAQQIKRPDEANVSARTMSQVLTHLRDRGGSWSWSPRLTAFVVDASTGEPGIDYSLPGLEDAAAIREQTHHRVASDVYASGD